MHASVSGVLRGSISRSIAIAAFALALTPFAAHAVYKCAGSGKGPIYQDEPCPPGKELRNFDTDPPNLSIVPGRPSAGAPPEAAPPPARAAREPKAARPDKRTKVRGNPAERKHVGVGMRDSEVLARLGAPDITAGGKQKRWTWLPVDGDPDTITTVTLVNGTVTDVNRKVVKK